MSEGREGGRERANEGKKKGRRERGHLETLLLNSSFESTSPSLSFHAHVPTSNA